MMPIYAYTVGVIKNMPLLKKCLRSLAIFYDSLKGYFSTFFFFLLSDDS
jgi:hypothetical protein